MKAMKIALLGTAALAAVSVSARADNLSDLKAQIEALNARVASIETAPQMPAGYQMVSFSKVGNDHIISIMPTADMPAATTITWNGYVRVAAVATGFGNTGADEHAIDLVSKAHLTVTGKTDTAVGEVGAKIAFQEVSNGSYRTNAGNGYLKTDGYWGWWKMTPNLTFGGGVDGSLSKNGYTYDAQCYHCAYTDYFGAIQNAPDGDPTQVRLSYADGPLGFAVALEDSRNSNSSNAYASAFGVAAKMTYAMDTFGVDISGGMTGNRGNDGDGSAAWNINGGVGANFAPVSIGAAVGFGHYLGGGDYTKASGYLKFAMSDSAHFDIGVSHSFNTGAQYTEFDAGLYYEPVKQLTIGVEGLYHSGDYDGNFYDGGYVADLVSIWSF